MNEIDEREKGDDDLPLILHPNRPGRVIAAGPGLVNSGTQGLECLLSTVCYIPAPMGPLLLWGV